MTKGSYDLSDHAPGPIRFYCWECHRWAQVQRDALVERFGLDQSMPDLLHKVQPCDRPNNAWSRCRLAYWDCMADSKRAAALARGDMPAGWEVRLEGAGLPGLLDLLQDIGRPPTEYRPPPYRGRR